MYINKYKYIYIYMCVRVLVCVHVYSDKQNITNINLHCLKLKSIRIGSYSGLLFPTSGVNTKSYGTYAL